MKKPSLSVALFVAAWALAVGGVACSDAPGRAEKFDRKVDRRASPGSFRKAGVSAVFEKRCGSLDCHGALERNLRIYSKAGLRLPDSNQTTGGADTTIDEITANYQSLMNLEPERANEVIAGADPEELLILKKPLELERHKGGPALKKGDVAYTCIRSWLVEDPTSAPVDAAACGDAARFPKN